MKRKTLKCSIAGLLTFSMVICMSASAGAYNLTSFRHKNSKIYYYYDNWIGYKAYYAAGYAANAWRAKTTEAEILHNSENPSRSYEVTILAGSFPNEGWDGVTKTEKETINGVIYVKSQTVKYNTASPAWNDENALKSVAVHEFGHVFGLHENNYTRTIMNSYTYGSNSRYETYGLTTPQTDDVNGVNAIY